MNYLLQGTAPPLNPQREEPLERSGGIPLQRGAPKPSTATPTRRHSLLPRARAALSLRRRTGRLPGPAPRASAGSGVSPIASGASRGVAILISR